MEIRMSVTRCQSELADFLQSKDWILYALIQGQIYLQVTKKQAKEEKLKDFWFEKSNIGIYCVFHVLISTSLLDVNYDLKPIKDYHY